MNASAHLAGATDGGGGRVGPAVASAACLLLSVAAPAVRAELRITEVAPGIYSGDAPRSVADYRQLQSLGIKTVVELRRFMPRAIAREQGLVATYGMAYQRIPVGFRPTRDCSPEQVLQVLTDLRRQPVYMHCNLGQDRTGLIIALYRVRYLGWGRETAFAAMKRDEFNPLLLDLNRYFWRYAE